MSKTKELRELVDKVKNDISIQVDTIVEWNLDNSELIQDLYRQSKENNEEFNELFQDTIEYLKMTSFEELFHEYTIKK
jgi:hypothetical protein